MNGNTLSYHILTLKFFYFMFNEVPDFIMNFITYRWYWCRRYRHNLYCTPEDGNIELLFCPTHTQGPNCFPKQCKGWG